jgi:Ca2+-binding RTX toxin-like protein
VRVKVPISIAFSLALAIGTSAFGTAQTASNSVPSSRVAQIDYPYTADTAPKPPACSALTLTDLVIGVTGNADANLLLATAAADTIQAAESDDCIVAGAGDDMIDAGGGNDVCIGGPGNDLFIDCETQIQ